MVAGRTVTSTASTVPPDPTFFSTALSHTIFHPQGGHADLNHLILTDRRAREVTLKPLEEERFTV
jgi:hypothetical protein